MLNAYVIFNMFFNYLQMQHYSAVKWTSFDKTISNLELASCALKYLVHIDLKTCCQRLHIIIQQGIRYWNVQEKILLPDAIIDVSLYEI